MFDDHGVCNVCRQIENKQTKIDWAAKRTEFEELLKQYRGKYAYDCIIPFSGGKDSTYTLYSLVREFGLRLLVVSFDHGFFRPLTLENNERTLKILGADFLKFRPNWRVMQKLMLEVLKRKGNICLHCHRLLRISHADRGEVRHSVGHLGRAKRGIWQLLQLRGRGIGRQVTVQSFRQSRHYRSRHGLDARWLCNVSGP
ncbi:MAG: hypothetical protein ACRERU_00835 [Methylococcales bacterium]